MFGATSFISLTDPPNMSSSSQVKQRRNAGKVQNGPGEYAEMAPVGAYDSSQLMATHGSLVDDQVRYRWVRITGKHRMASWRALLFNYVMEFAAVFILGLVVSFAAYFAGPTTSLVTGIAVGIIYGLTYLLVCRLPYDYQLRRHANPAVTLAYLTTNDIGILGVVYYLTAQVLGALMGGLVVGAILDQQNGGCAVAAIGCNIARATVPLAVTTNGAYGYGVSKVTVICTEIFMPAIIAMVLLLKEYLNTNPEKLQKNYNHAVKCAAVTTTVLVAIGYPFQIFSYNGAVYLTGLFSGLTTSFHARFISTLASLPGITGTTTDLLPNSVWGTTGDAAWALYYFGSFAGGLAAGLLARIIMQFGFEEQSPVYMAPTSDRRYRASGPTNPMINSQMSDATTPLMAAAAQTTHTQVADLINPYVASSILNTK